MTATNSPLRFIVPVLFSRPCALGLAFRLPMYEGVLVLGLVIVFVGLIAFKDGSQVSHTVTLTRFESSTQHDLMGYWGPPTAGIDWCERNHVVSHYIAEFYNTLSNIGLVAAGAYAIWQSAREGYGLRFIVAGGAVLLIGFGSAAYHGTLLWSAQMWDEIPMVWTMLVFIYINLRMQRGGSTALALGLTAYGLLWTMIHSLGSFVAAFQVHFGLLVLLGMYMNCRNVRIHSGLPLLPVRDEPAVPPAWRGLRRMVWLYIAYSVLAFVLWVLDQTLCERLHALPGGVPNPQLHAWWHLLNGAACHLALQSSIALRQSLVTKAVPSIRWRMGDLLASVVPASARSRRNSGCER